MPSKANPAFESKPRFQHGRLQQPLRVRLIIDEVADADDLSRPARRSSAVAHAAGRQRDPANHAGDIVELSLEDRDSIVSPTRSAAEPEWSCHAAIPPAPGADRCR